MFHTDEEHFEYCRYLHPLMTLPASSIAKITIFLFTHPKLFLYTCNLK